MSTAYVDEVTRLLQAMQAGDPHACDALYSLVYQELRRIAERKLAAERPGQTLSPTALVHEAYLRLAGETLAHWENRAHFFTAAARAMRQILIERARQRQSAKRRGQRESLTWVDPAAADEAPLDEILDLDAALHELESIDKRKADVVMLRFFAGLTVEETARAMDLSPATVKNDWNFAKAWLYREISAGDPAPTGTDAP